MGESTDGMGEAEGDGGGCPRSIDMIVPPWRSVDMASPPCATTTSSSMRETSEWMDGRGEASWRWEEIRRLPRVYGRDDRAEERRLEEGGRRREAGVWKACWAANEGEGERTSSSTPTEIR